MQIPQTNTLSFHCNHGLTFNKKEEMMWAFPLYYVNTIG